MPDFKEIRNQLSDARSAAGTAQSTHFAVAETLKRIQREMAGLEQIAGDNNTDYLRRKTELAGLQENLEEVLSGNQAVLERARLFEQGIWQQFLPQNDPREQLNNLDDKTPILLFPLRLETRFKKITQQQNGGEQDQLWVRIYPDECSVDTFEELLTESELRSARIFWQEWWKAGGQEAQQRGAWAGLVAAHGSGRAAWIAGKGDAKLQSETTVEGFSKTYQPLSPEPLKSNANDLILVITVEGAPLFQPAEEAALKQYWKSVWQAKGNLDDESTAFSSFVNAVNGENRAKFLLDLYKPYNLKDRPKSDSTEVKVEILHLPSKDTILTRSHAWSSAPRVSIMPERFVLLGYNGNTLTINQLGNAIPSPLIVGPDPNISRPEDGKPEDAFDALVHQEIRWMTDFEEAVSIGMGFKIGLTPQQARLGFDRLMVVGVQLGTNETEGAQTLQHLLLRHQYSSKGFGLLPQGAATNNTETQNAAFTRADDPDLSFDLYFKPPTPPEDGLPDNPTLLKRDGEWLSQWLGFPQDTFNRTLYANGADQCEARAMNTALWPVTMGHMMDSMMQEVFSDLDVELTRYFFTSYVSGRGPIPALRIGKQPYGILPTGNFRAMKWFEQRPTKGKQNAFVYLKKLHTVLSGLTNEWQEMVKRADWVAKKNTHDGKPVDAHQMLLNIVGLYPNSVEFYQRYTPGRHFWWNYMYISGFHHYFSFTNWRFNTKSQREVLQPETPDMAEGLDKDGMELLEKFGYKGEAKPDILDKIFMKWANRLQGPVVDDRPLSETDPIRAYTAGTSGINYIQWLINNAINTEILRKQEGFKDNQIPTALLYLMLHQALLEGYFDAGLRAHLDFDLSDAQSLRQARIDIPFIQMQERNAVIIEAMPVRESKYEWLYTSAPVETYSSMFSFLGANLFKELPATRYLSAQVDALKFLANTPTARLERVFVEHIDTVSYRLDAWKTGFNHILLDEMREEKPEGIFIGAYGWLENVRSENKTLSPVTLPAELQKDFQEKGDAPLLKDNTNSGHILGPSLNHTVAAAILRNGYLSNASSANSQTLAVNLTSERVRKAMGLLEGIQNGQPLGALLGYHLERGLHDRYNEATNFSVNEVIYDLRLAFPLYGGQLAKSAEDDPRESVEANNVINGLDLANQIKSNAANKQYPFGKGDVLPTLTDEQITAINEEVDRMLDVHDAVADLVMAESVYQVTLGNYDRAAATLDAVSKAGFPPEPQVAQTPRTGVGLTHRVGLHLNASAVAASDASPRATFEPAIDEWLQSRLPPLDKIGCQVYYVDPGGNNQPLFVSLTNMGLSAIDLLYVINQSLFTPATDLRANTNTGSDTSSRRAFAEIDDRIEYYIREGLLARIDEEIRIAYVEPVSAGNHSLFEIASLLKSLRAVLLSSRNLMPGDLSLPEEATDELNARVAFKTERINALDGVINTTLPGMQVLFLNLAEPLRDLRDLEKQILELEKQISALSEGSDPSAIQAQIDSKKNDIAALKTTIRGGSDTLAQEMIKLLKEAGTYGFPDTGIGIIYADRRRILESLRKKATDYQARWENKLTEFDIAIAQFENSATPEWQKIDILRKAERTVSTGFVPGTTYMDIEGSIKNKRALFENKLNELKAILDTLPTSPLVEYNALVTFKLNTSDFDLLELNIVEEANQLYIYAEDLLIRADLLSKHLDSTAPASGQKPSFMLQLKEAFGKISSAAEGVEKAQAVIATAQLLFGEEFRMIPTYAVPSKISATWQNAHNGAESLLDFQKNILKNDFPIDDWLHGIARVHEKMWHWENITLLSSPFGQTEPELNPFQLPVKPDDRWYALQYRLDTPTEKFNTPEHDHLLYTPHYGSAIDTNELCGVLIDEWTEVIPNKEETIGLGFHYDRPNCEPPQTWLMVLPTQIKNAWDWNDLTAALTDTLDEAKRRAVEPSFIDDTALARFLPATMATVTDHPITLQMNYAVNNIKY